MKSWLRLALGVAWSLTLLPGIARGQESTEAKPATPPEPPVVTTAPPTAPNAPQEKVIIEKIIERPAPVSKAPEGPTDHESLVGHWGVGFVGSPSLPLASAVPIGNSEQPGMIPNDIVTIQRILTPTLGARKWISKRLAIDVGLGLGFAAGDTTADYAGVTASVEKPTVYSFVLQAGIPIAIADTRHMTFFVAPQMTFGFAGSNVAPQFEQYAPPDAKLRGLQFNVGATAGAELYFGFIGLPRLALQGGIGLFMNVEWASATVANQSISDTTVGISPSWGNDPWDILSSGNVAARYYF